MSIYSTLGTTTTVGFASYIYNGYDKEKGEYDPKRAKKLGTTTLCATATTVVGQISDKKTMDRINNEYAAAYVDSMSDEELERALIALGQLESDEDVNNLTKTI